MRVQGVHHDRWFAASAAMGTLLALASVAQAGTFTFQDVGDAGFESSG